MPKKFRTASTQLEVEEWNRYKELCANNGLTPYKDLHEYVQGRLKPDEEKKVDERIREKELENRTEGDSSGHLEGMEGGADPDPCPFC